MTRRWRWQRRMGLLSNFPSTLTSREWRMAVRTTWASSLLGAVCAVGLGVVPASAKDSSLAAATIRVSAAGLSPAILRLTASVSAPSCENVDAAAHTVAFKNGLCTLTLAPTARQTCDVAFWRYVGTFPYTLDGSGAGRLVITPATRRLTIATSRKTIRHGQEVVLSGTLFYETSQPAYSGQLVTLTRQAKPSQKFTEVAAVRSTASSIATTRIGTFKWQVVLCPRVSATYRAEDFVQPAGGKIWEPATSSPIAIRVRNPSQ